MGMELKSESELSYYCYKNDMMRLRLSLPSNIQISNQKYL